MKTVKILLMAVVAAATVYSCSSERDEEVQSNPAQTKLDLKKLKTNNNSGSTTAKEGDTILVQPQKLPGEGLDPGNTDPNEGGDPKDVPVPPRR